MAEDHRDTVWTPVSRRAAFHAAGGGLAVAAALLSRPAAAQPQDIPDVVAELLVAP